MKRRPSACALNPQNDKYGVLSNDNKGATPRDVTPWLVQVVSGLDYLFTAPEGCAHLFRDEERYRTTAMSLGLWAKLTAGVRCERCGLKLQVEKMGLHTRFKVDPDVWARRCKALTPSGGPGTPFECADLKAATAARKQ